MRILVEVINPLGVEAACPALDSMNRVSFLQQQLGQVTAILACDTGDESRLHKFNLGLLLGESSRHPRGGGDPMGACQSAAGCDGEACLFTERRMH
jgi:hypothetical protein